MPLMRCPSGPSNDTSEPQPKARQTLMISVGEFCWVLNGSFCVHRQHLADAVAKRGQFRA